MTQTAVSGSADTAHHTLAPHEVVLLLESDPRHGLSEEEAERRQQQYGPNMLPQTKGSGLVMRWLRQFHHPLIYILLAAGAITGLLGAWVDATVIFAVVVVNAVIGFLQESKAEAALEGLRSMIHTQARTVRGGQVRQVPSEELVPGDLVLVEAGDKVPADLRLVRLAPSCGPMSRR